VRGGVTFHRGEAHDFGDHGMVRELGERPIVRRHASCIASQFLQARDGRCREIACHETRQARRVAIVQQRGVLRECESTLLAFRTSNAGPRNSCQEYFNALTRIVRRVSSSAF
jgi:hypothetical protein